MLGDLNRSRISVCMCVSIPRGEHPSWVVIRIFFLSLQGCVLHAVLPSVVFKLIRIAVAAQSLSHHVPHQGFT